MSNRFDNNREWTLSKKNNQRRQNYMDDKPVVLKPPTKKVSITAEEKKVSITAESKTISVTTESKKVSITATTEEKKVTVTAESKKVAIVTEDKKKTITETSRNNVVSSYFELFDKKVNLIENEIKTTLATYNESIDPKEFENALKFICEKNNLNNDDWYAINEAHDYILDNKRINLGIHPIHSDHYNSGIVSIPKPCNKETLPEIEDANNLPLQDPIALVFQYKKMDKDEWVTRTLCIMKTVGEFWGCINNINFFTDPNGYSTESEKKFKDLIDGSFRGVFKLSTDVQQKIRVYNSMQTFWYFIKVPITTKIDEEINIPFKRDEKGVCINDININLKETRDNMDRKIYSFHEDFSMGFIPFLILDFAGANLPDAINTIIFSRTIATQNISERGTNDQKCLCFRGFRVRALVVPVRNETKRISPVQEKELLKRNVIQCHKHIREKFINEISQEFGTEYRKCLVNCTIYKPWDEKNERICRK